MCNKMMYKITRFKNASQYILKWHCWTAKFNNAKPQLLLHQPNKSMETFTGIALNFFTTLGRIRKPICYIQSIKERWLSPFIFFDLF